MEISDMGQGLIFVLGVMLPILIVRWINDVVRYKKKRLPPGTMGWPVIGQTFNFMKEGPDFMKNRRKLYGDLFKTHILGCPTVVCMDPDINKQILNSESKGFIPGYPQAMLDILGEWNTAAVHGAPHKAMRGVLLSLVSPPMIRDHLLPKIDAFMKSFLAGMGGEVVDIQAKTKEMALLSSLKQIASIEGGPLAQSLKTELYQLALGTLSLPINFPGSNYRRGLQARRRLVGMLREMIEERRASQISYNDMLDNLLNSDESTKLKLTDDQIIDLIITLIYSGYETMSTTSMMAIKYLHDHPRALLELRRENLEIRKGKPADYTINYNDYKSMIFTRAVVYETLRMATVVNGLLRKLTQDVELKGFVIPKGWRIYVYTREINYNPETYSRSLQFNPWRWLENNLESHQHFMLFGSGTRLCPGKEVGTVEICTFLHYMVTRYWWKEVGKNNIMKFPRVQAPNGLHFKLTEYEQFE
ncbi:cytochrome P450 85A1-like protein [Carex littledalei]|uniref:Cytochrome P450 85A1-like protein n=1 Tax=Carex littledalei TaxID=544730 RepID=A0A833QKP8_9POAL|nr:cytochrome P450 85A1-like protein [Carex littledalei]